MEVAESSPTEEEEEEEDEEQQQQAAEPRPPMRSNPEGAEDRALGAQASVGSRSEGEGEAASTDDGPPGVSGASTKPWQVPLAAPDIHVRTPRVNCPEKVIICLDLAEEMSLPKLESLSGSKTNALNVSQKMIEMFVRTKHKIDKSHEFALVVVNDDMAWLSGLTSDPRELCSCLYDLETAPCSACNLEGLFNLIQQKTEVPVTENVQTVPPPYVVRTILVYSRAPSQPHFTLTEPVKKMLQCPYFFFDVIYIHNGAEEKEEDLRWKGQGDCPYENVQTVPPPYVVRTILVYSRAPSQPHFTLTEPVKDVFAFMGSLDTKGTSYKYEVALTGPALELHNCMAKLLAHPLQRPCQGHASYSLLGGDEEEATAEVEATV